MRYRNLLFILLGLSACAPQVPLHQSDPAAPEPVTIAESPEVTIALEHLGTQFGHQVFLASFTNHLPDSVWVKPKRVSYYASGKMFDTPAQASEIHAVSYANSKLITRRTFASAPAYIMKLAADRSTNLKVLAGMAVLVSTAVIVHDAVKDEQDYTKETWTTIDNNRAFSRDLVVGTSLLLADASAFAESNATAERYYLEEAVLPDVHLPPGRTVQGKIFLRAETSYRYTRVVIPFSTVEYVFDFKRKNAPGKLRTWD